jgi:hypothetical protein
MMFRWTLPEGTLAFEDRTFEAVLVEIDGPQLVTALDAHGKRYLGLFADRLDDDRELWLYAPISDLELEALFAGAVSMRNAMSKPALDLIEHKGKRASGIWRLSPDDLPAGLLPVPDANLRIDDGAELLAKLLGKQPPTNAGPIFRYGGRPVKDSHIALGALSGIAGSLQVLWSAIANDVLPSPRLPEELAYFEESQTLRMSGSQAASFGMIVSPEHVEPFRRVSETYRALARLSPETLSAARISPAVLTAYAAFLKTLSDFDAEVFAQLGDAQAYTGAGYAVRVGSAIRALREPADEALVPHAASTGRGFFHAASIEKRTFVFFDTVTNQELHGKIAKDIAEAMTKAAQEISVGNQTLYDVQIEARGRRGTLTLVHLHRVAPQT